VSLARHIATDINMLKIKLMRLGKYEIRKAPASSGVYIFRDKNSKVLYVGKSANLKERLRQHFQQSNLYDARRGKLAQQTKEIELRLTQSELEALILESQLIKNLNPPYNIQLRDDKGYFYVQITKEEFPRIFIVHEKIFATSKTPASYIGPFTSKRALSITLKLLRKVFPYCTCKQSHKNLCLNARLGLCPGYCCSLRMQQELKDANKIKQDYQQNIKKITRIIKGQGQKLLNEIKKEMRKKAEEENFERAQKLREEAEALEKVLAHKNLIKDSQAPGPKLWLIENPDILKIKQMLEINFKNIKRIEGYDISNLGGSQATGSMVVFRQFENGIFRIDKSQYRKFRIKTKSNPDDPAMMKEILKRRFRHQEWPLPQLILLDGGKTQLEAGRQARAGQGHRPTKFVFIALAKNSNSLYLENKRRSIPLQDIPQNLRHLLLSIRDEAHRFAVAYHRKLRTKKLLRFPAA